MKKRQLWVSILAGLLAAVMVLGLIAGLIPRANAESSSEIKKRIDALEDEKDEIDARIKELEGQFSDNMDEMEEIVARKDLIDQEVFLLNQQITNINSQIAEYGLLIADKQDELDVAEAHLADLQAKNADRIRAMEKSGTVSYWSVIFGANNFVDLLDRLKMVEEIQAADKARIAEMTAAADAVAVAKAALEDEKVALEASKAELDATQVELEAKRDEANTLLAELNAKGEEFEALIEESEEIQDELMDKIAKAEDEYETAKQKEWAAANPSPSTPPPTVNNGPTNNVDGVTWKVPINYTSFTSPFGYRWHPVYGGWRMHNGVDLAAPTGTPIYATRSGTVTTASYQSGGAGYYVNISHGDGYSSIYMHMTHYVVSYGQYVQQGQVIGYCGSTGASTGPHLHFGIAYNGTYVNPANYIRI